MTISLKHKFTSPKSDSVDSTLVNPSNWNDEHALTLGAGVIIGRDASGAGAYQELPLAFDATGQSMVPPKGTTAARPTPVAGMFRFNTDISKFECYNGTAWASVGGGSTISASAPASPFTGDLWYDTVNTRLMVYNAGWVVASAYSVPVRQQFTATGGQTSFTVSGGYSPNLVDVYKNGAKLLNGTAVTVTSGTAVVLASGATGGDIIEVIGVNSFALVNAVLNTGGSITGDLVLTGKLDASLVESIAASGNAAVNVRNNNGTGVATDSTGVFQGQGNNASSVLKNLGQMLWRWVNPAGGSEAANFEFWNMVAGTLTKSLVLGAGLFTPNATGGDKGADSINTKALYLDGKLSGAPHVIIEDQKAAATAMQTLTANTDTQLILNTLVYNAGTLASLASNQFTLPAGTYYIKVNVPNNQNTPTRCWVHNVTDAAVAILGGNGAFAVLQASGVITIAANKTFEIRGRCNATASLMSAENDTRIEIYTHVEITKIA